MQVRLVDSGDLKALNKALKQLEDGKEIRKALGRELRGIVRDQGLVEDVRQAWRTAPSQEREAPKLREALAKATRVQVRFTGKEAGVLIRTDGRKMPDKMKALPAYAEGIRRKPWRHPVYGNRNAWVTQKPFPRFYEAVQPNQAAARRQLEQAVLRTMNQIVRAR
jgi:hypothetical protein